jgi:hypothetical protein
MDAHDQGSIALLRDGLCRPPRLVVTLASDTQGELSGAAYEAMGRDTLNQLKVCVGARACYH